MEGQPFALCPRNPKSLPFVKELVEQVLRLHPDIQHLHIGADEVWNIGDETHMIVCCFYVIIVSFSLLLAMNYDIYAVHS